MMDRRRTPSASEISLAPDPGCTWGCTWHRRVFTPVSLLRITLAGLILLLALSCGQVDPIVGPIIGPEVEEGAILVTSSVAGAGISLDGESTSLVTPDTLENVQAGRHFVSVFLQGYFIDSDSVTVATDSLHALHFELALIPTVGSIAVTAPYPAAILLDGTPTGATAPDTLRGIEAGDHVVTLVLPGFAPDPAELSVTVEIDAIVDADFALTVPKKIICEDFSNYACIPCPAADIALQAVIAEQPAGRLISLNPHGWWPGPADPFYQFNTFANRGRVLFYGVPRLPTMYVDGLRVEDQPITEEKIRTRVDERPATTSPLALGVSATLAGGEYSVTVDAWGVDEGIPVNMILFTCVVETDIYLDPAGPNGQVHYVNVLREILPPPLVMGEPGGVPLAISNGGHLTFEYTYVVPAGSIDPDHLAVIAFAQVSDTKEVVQTGTTIDP